MSKLKRSFELESPFEIYTVDEILGEGGSGRVYGAKSSDGTEVAIKVLLEDSRNTNKRRRFKNETAFLARTSHPNIVSVLDYGIASDTRLNGPFYVMPRYHQSLRGLMASGFAADNVLPMFAQVLDGVEAAHLKGVVHRDIKPENVLANKDGSSMAVCDFGVATFTGDALVTAVETRLSDRLANFVYAAPEQKMRGVDCGVPADIYALGLVLNEMFTHEVAHGTGYRTVEHASPEHAFLDSIIAQMLRQSPLERPQSIREVKDLIAKHRADAVSLQKISDIDGTVVNRSDIDDPLALEPPKIHDFDFTGGTLTLRFDRQLTSKWIAALRNMGNYSSLMGKGPEVWGFRSNEASVSASEHEIQGLIDHFKAWLPQATRVLHANLEREAHDEESRRLAELKAAREREEQQLRLRRDIRL